MAYIGNNTSIQQYAPTISYFNGNGSTTVFTLPIPVASAAQVIVHVENVPQNPATAFTVSGTTLTFTSAPPTGSNNIWVEYTSLQSNSIAPSQGTVQNSSFGSITSIPFVNGGSLGGGNSTLMKNRIINGAMTIAQYSTGSVTPTTNTYGTVDRWKYYVTQASKFTAQQNAGSVTPPVGFSNYLGITSSSAYSVGATDYFLTAQAIEGFNTADLAWGTADAKPVTLSFQVRSSLTGTFGGAINNSAQNYSYPFTYSIPVANTWTTVSVTIAGPTSGTWIGATNGIGMYVFFGLGVGSTYSGTAGSWAGSLYLGATGATSVVGTSGATFYITGVQLEVGTSATGFEYRQYQQELALCQRYFLQNNVPTNYYYAIGYCHTTTEAYFDDKFPVSMRTSPTFSVVNNFNILKTGAAIATTGITFNASQTWGARFYASVASGLVGGQACEIYTASSTSIIAYSAEL